MNFFSIFNQHYFILNFGLKSNLQNQIKYKWWKLSKLEGLDNYRVCNSNPQLLWKCFEREEQINWWLTTIFLQNGHHETLLHSRGLIGFHATFLLSLSWIAHLRLWDLFQNPKIPMGALNKGMHKKAPT